MSRKTIRNTPRRKKSKGFEVTVKQALTQQLALKRNIRKQAEENAVLKLVKEEELDVDKRHDYKYMYQVAKSINWSIGRLNKVLDRMVNPAIPKDTLARTLDGNADLKPKTRQTHREE